MTTPGTTNGSALSTPATQAQSMAQLRAQLDPLIAQLGTVTEVKTDTVVACGGSDGSGGYAATYNVWMTPAAGAQDMVAATVVPQLTSDGWRVEQSTNTDEVDWTFHKAHIDFGLTFHPNLSNLVVGGSGACLPEKV